jgi:hypothetical protein
MISARQKTPRGMMLISDCSKTAWVKHRPFYKVAMKQDKQGHNVPDKWEKMGTELLNIRLVGANDEFVDNKASGFTRTSSGSAPKRSMSRSISSFSGFSR